MTDHADSRADSSTDNADSWAESSTDNADSQAEFEERPDPATIVDALDGPLLLFDGVCNLCNSVVRLVLRHDDAGIFRFAPLQSAIGEEVLGRHGLSTEEFDSIVLVEDGEYYRKSTAALRVCRRLGRPFSLLGPFGHLPPVLRDPVYDLVARYRYRVFGRSDECQIPEPEIRERFAERALETN
jgi:predicted DCC family thiol-disulfide oxidoreductase YuxK